MGDPRPLRTARIVHNPEVSHMPLVALFIGSGAAIAAGFALAIVLLFRA
jgi:hypothetical protein